MYPDGGGQPADHGWITSGGKTFKVVDVNQHNGVIIHTLDSEAETGAGADIKVGASVSCKLDIERRMDHARHHTGTHLMISACREVLGNHVWQAGSQNEATRARLDISHFRPITDEVAREIERVANRKIALNTDIEIDWLDREIAEKKHGLVLYQGGAPTHKVMRIVNIPGHDVEGCGGTHCSNTGEVGFLKIIRSERIQDGVERIEFCAGPAALAFVQEQEGLLRKTAHILSVPPDQLPKTAQRFFDEWKERGKEIDKLSRYEAIALSEELIAGGEQRDGYTLVIKELNKDVKAISAIARSVIAKPGILTFLYNSEGSTKMVVAKSKDVDADCSALLRAVMAKLGGSGGGRPDFAQGGGKPASVKEVEDAIKASL